ncbi:glycosyltransferase family 4 protein [Algoriphagus zhangzhouensis]|uniref:Glycosyltransferase involved in cell wall bisynthesis n=1 Tax=Algoriphagus zhangzhouensis TaxID=1073327 RepID=A0A1M7ZAV0_9BACT|nr:glycosyltransferase family 4 protein [Algoriphagus zhangzhouensis]TDY47003.1 glycosyltransferase involved in cell wall biosynthesis [Algoriphagus zhangzhouensis]SHO62038.1 Glycosyltransferase involved in cell wall bisynthesis [Algoriphagus zhangzhouensis]
MPKTRNVLFLQSSSELYGSGKIILQVLRVYQKEGFNPIVVLTGPGAIQGYLEKENIPVYIQNLGILRRKYVNPQGLINRFNKNLKAYRFLSELHEKYQFELVYSNTLAVIVGAYWAQKNQLPHIWHIHEILPGPAPLVKLLSKILDKSTAKPIAVSQAVADHWQGFLKKAQIEVIHNGIPYGEFLDNFPNAKKELGIPESSIVIGMIGRINPGKGQLFFLEMARQLSLKYPETHFVLVGDPFPGYEPILDEIIEKIQHEDFEGKVSYLGFREDIPKVLAGLDIFVLPSILPDSFPTVILEAMAAAKPILATRTGGAVEMVAEGKTGFIIEPEDLETGVSQLSKLIEQKDLRNQLGEAGRNRVLSEFSLEAFEERIKKHLWEHLEKN